MELINFKKRQKIEPFFLIHEILNLLNLELVDTEILAGGYMYSTSKDENGNVTKVDSYPDMGYQIALKDKETNKYFQFSYAHLLSFLIDYAKAYATNEVKDKISKTLSVIGIERSAPYDLQMQKPEKEKKTQNTN
jgi:hypothetical protein